MMSGTRVHHFKEGWALWPIPHPKVAHYWRREDIGLAEPVCGAPAKPAGMLLDAGDWTRCARCSALRMPALRSPGGSVA